MRKKFERLKKFQKFLDFVSVIDAGWLSQNVVNRGWSLHFWNLTQLPNIFISEFKDTIQGIWIIFAPVARDHFYDTFSFRFKNSS